MGCPRAQARLIESLISCAVIIASLVIANPYLLTSSLVTEKIDKQEIANKSLEFLLINRILKQAYYGNYSIIANALEKIIPIELGFKITIFYENYTVKWSYQRSNFKLGDSKSAQVVLNGCNGTEFTYFLVVNLAVSS